MTARSSEEKSPIDRVDYEGLQLDTRARDHGNPYLDEKKPQTFFNDDFDDEDDYPNEKQDRSLAIPPDQPTSPNITIESGFSPITQTLSQEIHGQHVSPPPPKERQICGLPRRHFWKLFGLILLIVIVAAVIGGAVGGTQAHKTHSSSVAPLVSSALNGSNATRNSPLQQSDVMVASPLNVISYDQGGSTVESRQAFRIYYQSALGNIKEAVSNGMASWQPAVPIFTDAINNTGLATVTYLNGSNQQSSIFYVGMNGLLQEKRKVYSSTEYWEPGSLNSKNLVAVGNLSLPSEADDPQNDWDGYRMAAVYSENFHSGPGLRLFYHAEQLNGTSHVQELVWIQSNDSWSQGAKLHDPYPNSHLAATIDESTRTLRLFFSSGNGTLQEAWTSISDPTPNYSNGLNIPNYLAHNNAEIAAVSKNGTTYLYNYASSSQPPATEGIHELRILGTPGPTESFNLSSPRPLLTENGITSFYQPLAASMTAVPGLAEQVYVFWADKMTGDNFGDPAVISGYGQLAEISRPVSGATWPSTGRSEIPLGDNNAQPSQKKA